MNAMYAVNNINNINTVNVFNAVDVFNIGEPEQTFDQHVASVQETTAKPSGFFGERGGNPMTDETAGGGKTRRGIQIKDVRKQRDANRPLWTLWGLRTNTLWTPDVWSCWDLRRPGGRRFESSRGGITVSSHTSSVVQKRRGPAPLIIEFCSPLLFLSLFFLTLETKFYIILVL